MEFSGKRLSSTIPVPLQPKQWLLTKTRFQLEMANGWKLLLWSDGDHGMLIEPANLPPPRTELKEGRDKARTIPQARGGVAAD